MYKLISVILFVIALFNYLLLAFAYRDLSIGLIIMALISLIGLPLATFMIVKGDGIKFRFWFTSEDDEIKKLGNTWKDPEEDDEEYNLEGRFCINP